MSGELLLVREEREKVTGRGTDKIGFKEKTKLMSSKMGSIAIADDQQIRDGPSISRIVFFRTLSRKER